MNKSRNKFLEPSENSAERRSAPRPRGALKGRSFKGGAKGPRRSGPGTESENGNLQRPNFRSRRFGRAEELPTGESSSRSISRGKGERREEDGTAKRSFSRKRRTLKNHSSFEAKRPQRTKGGSEAGQPERGLSERERAAGPERPERREKMREGDARSTKGRQRGASVVTNEEKAPERGTARRKAHPSRKPSSKRDFHPTFRGFFNGGTSSKSVSSKKASKKKKKNALSALVPNKLDPLDVERNSVTLQHSVFVACAARKLAERIPGLDPDEAFAAGLYHDFGKFYLPRGWVYRHPRLGYELLRNLKKDTPLLAHVCLVHPFPVIENEAYFTLFCRGDETEAKEIKALLKPLKPILPSLDEPLDPANGEGVIVRLIQLCDKLSGFNRYVTLEEKFSWYEEWSARASESEKAVANSPRDLEAQTRAVNYEAWQTIKRQIEALIGDDVYDVLGIVSTETGKKA